MAAKKSGKPKAPKKAKAPTGRAKGGVARSEALTPEKRAEIAHKAAVARWGEKMPVATHRGNFLKEFGIDVDCYVLGDDNKTAVISKRGLGAALGLDSSSGSALSRFVRGERFAKYCGGELLAKLENPLSFQWSAAGAKLNDTAHGYDVTILIDICQAIIRASHDGALGSRHGHVIKQAQVIVLASAKAGIRDLVYALAGYDQTREEVIAAFKQYVREVAREYEKEFPPQLYAEWYRLYNLRKPAKNNPWKFRLLTLKHVYKPLANSHGHILALTRQSKAHSGDRHARLHQFLSEVGVKALRMHLGQLLGMAQVSKDSEIYERHVSRVFFGQPSLFDILDGPDSAGG